jgi:hypothetical protein
MKQLIYLIAAILFLAFAGCTSRPKTEGTPAEAEGEEEVAVADNTLTDKEKAEGWILLFDGETTDGWRGYNKEAFPDTGWYVENGTLHCIHSGLGEAGLGGDIIYDRKFSDFHLKVDWMIDSGGNSGVFYLAQEIPGKQIWYTGPEMQILDNESGHVDNTLGKDGNRRAGSLYDLIPPDPQNARGPMQWNSFEIMSYQGTIVYYMNGENVMEFHLWTPEWNEMIKNSKYPEFNPDFANVAREGYIGLQDHGNAVWFKNIKLKEL